MTITGLTRWGFGGGEAAPEILCCGPRAAALPPHAAHKKRFLEGHPAGTRPSKPPMSTPTAQVLFIFKVGRFSPGRAKNDPQGIEQHWQAKVLITLSCR